MKIFWSMISYVILCRATNRIYLQLDSCCLVGNMSKKRYVVEMARAANGADFGRAAEVEQAGH